jgi:hypothetical protein
MSVTNNDQWYSTPNLQELPLTLTVPDASKLLGIQEGTGWRLARTAWKPFTKTVGKLVLVKTGGLLRWVDNDETKEQ